MKANKAPEKIHIPVKHYAALYAFAEKEKGSDIEYTRTDAFIEKACVKLKKLMYDNLMFQGRLHREEVIDNFVEDFKKNYMKGE